MRLPVPTWSGRPGSTVAQGRALRPYDITSFTVLVDGSRALRRWQPPEGAFSRAMGAGLRGTGYRPRDFLYTSPYLARFPRPAQRARVTDGCSRHRLTPASVHRSLLPGRARA